MDYRIQLPRKSLIKWAFYYYALNLPIFWLIAARYFIGAVPPDTLGLLFVITAILGHYALFSALLVLVPSLLVSALYPKKYFVMSIAFITTLLGIIYLSIDSSVFASYRFHLNGIILQMIFSSAFNQIFDFSWIEWLLASIYIIVLILLELFLSQFLWKKTQTIQRHYYLISGLISLLICYLISQSLYAWNSTAYMYEGAEYAQSTISAADKIPLYYGVTAKDFLLTHNFIIPKQNNNMALANLTANTTNSDLNYPLHPLTAKPSKKPLNIMLIVLDTWRSDMMTPDTTPQIYNFSKQAAQYTNHYSGGDCTEPGIFSLFYGIPASYWPTFLNAHRGPALIDELRKQNYQLAVYASASLYKPDFYQTVFVNVPNLKIENPQPQPWQRDEYINQEMIKFLKNRKQNQPFFGFLFYDAIHEYDVPPNFKTKFNPYWKTIDHLALTNTFDPTEYINRYKNSVLFVDGLVGQILATLKQQHLLNNTVIIITADHGEEFNDNHKDYWGHASNFSAAQMQTPFIVYWPNQPPHVYQHFTTHYDLAPLLMKNVLNVNNPIPDYSIGQILKDPGNRSVIPVSSYTFNGFIEPQDNRITTLLGGGLYTVTNDKLDPIEKGRRSDVQHLRTVFEMMHRYYQ